MMKRLFLVIIVFFALSQPARSGLDESELSTLCAAVNHPDRITEYQKFIEKTFDDPIRDALRDFPEIDIQTLRDIKIQFQYKYEETKAFANRMDCQSKVRDLEQTILDLRSLSSLADHELLVIQERKEEMQKNKALKTDEKEKNRLCELEIPRWQEKVRKRYERIKNKGYIPDDFENTFAEAQVLGKKICQSLDPSIDFEEFHSLSQWVDLILDPIKDVQNLEKSFEKRKKHLEAYAKKYQKGFIDLLQRSLDDMKELFEMAKEYLNLGFQEGDSQKRFQNLQQFHDLENAWDEQVVIMKRYQHLPRMMRKSINALIDDIRFTARKYHLGTAVEKSCVHSLQKRLSEIVQQIPVGTKKDIDEFFSDTLESLQKNSDEQCEKIFQYPHPSKVIW